VLGFAIEDELAGSIHKNRELLLNISSERISAELSKMIVGGNILNVLLNYPDVLSVFIPEIGPAINFEQKNPYHIYDVWAHTAHSVGLAVPELTVRLSMLFHDLGKPATFSLDDDGVGHFYRHNKESEKIASRRLRELRFDKETAGKVSKLVKWHDAQIPSNCLVRWLNKLGEDSLRCLFNIKRADALAQNKLYAHDRIQDIEKLERELDLLITDDACYRLADLMVTGRDIIGLGVEPGPEIGKVLHALLDKVMDDELENDRDALLREARILSRNPETYKTIHVVGAVILKDKKVLATQRGYGDYKGWWEFPGGKVESGEEPVDALKREIWEELSAEIDVERYFDTTEYDYEKFHVSLRCYLCALRGDEFFLTEHLSAKWLSASEIYSVKWLAADIPVIEKMLKEDII
jgi:mutator protein MutT